MTVSDNAREYRGARVLVLGAAGFIGRWVAAKLSFAGADLALAVRDREAAARIFSAYGVSGQVEIADLADKRAVVDLIERVCPAVIFNLAGYGIDFSEKNSEQARLINAELPAVLAENLPVGTGWRGRSLVHAGSGIEYGAATGTLVESTTPHPVSAYAVSKLAGSRALLERAAANAPGRSIVVRLFTVYGAGEHEGRLLPSLIAAAAARQPIELTSGTQLRDFTYVEDVADGLLLLGKTQPSSIDTVNLATGAMTSVRAFVENAARTLSLPAELLHFGTLPTRADEMRASRIDPSVLRSLAGWLPPTEIAAGIERTANFYKRLASADDNHIV